MTFAVAILSPEYALVMADFRSILPGPNTVPMPDGSICTLAEDEQIVVDSDIRLDKITFHPDLREAFSFAGSYSLSEPYLGFETPLAGFDADEHLARRFEKLAAFRGLTALPRGEMDTSAALHIFREDDQFLATRVYAGPAIFTRHTYRHFLDRLRWIGIGSGDNHVTEALRQGPLADEWAALSQRTSIASIDDIILFWGKLFALASTREYDVNSVVSSWIRTAESERWGRRGIHRFDAAGTLAETLYSHGEEGRPIIATWRVEKKPSSTTVR